MAYGLMVVPRDQQLQDRHLQTGQ